jgi:hypothetical protein
MGSKSSKETISPRLMVAALVLPPTPVPAPVLVLGLVPGLLDQLPVSWLRLELSELPAAQQEALPVGTTANVMCFAAQAQEGHPSRIHYFSHH